MKKTISCLILLVIGFSGFTLKAEGNAVINADQTLNNESLLLDKKSDLFSGLVWDKNKITLKKNKSDFGKQLWKNANFGWNTYKNDDYKWRNIFIGTGYGRNFQQFKKAYWMVGLNLNWSKYTLYPNGAFNFTANKDYLKTTSFSVPVTAGYTIYTSKLRSMNLKAFTGPVFEYILTSKLNGYTDNQYPINNFQTGWSVGANFRFLYLLSARVTYTYYPYSLFENHDLYRRALSFSLGF
ncbi:MAG: hypothetical protein H6Q19_2130 [Bacteroidetes bacterium]|nr:hypothetical protein [Bacteroidota bacterium]